MHRLNRFLVIGSLGLAAISTVYSAPAAPTGFRWQRLDAIRASILLPDGWHYFAKDTDGKLAYFVTKDPFDGTGEFRTGLSLNCVRALSKKAKMLPSAYIDAFTAEAKTKYSIIDPKTNTAGPAKLIWFGMISPKKGPDATRMTYFLIANDSTDTAYIVIFEAPLSDWEKAYEAGNIMLKNVLIDPSF